jgi:hypothetical protein
LTPALAEQKREDFDSKVLPQNVTWLWSSSTPRQPGGSFAQPCRSHTWTWIWTLLLPKKSFWLLCVLHLSCTPEAKVRNHWAVFTPSMEKSPDLHWVVPSGSGDRLLTTLSVCPNVLSAQWSSSHLTGQLAILPSGSFSYLAFCSNWPSIPLKCFTHWKWEGQTHQTQSSSPWSLNLSF